MTRQPTSAQMPTCAKETAARLCEDKNITRQPTSAQMTISAEETAIDLCKDEILQMIPQGKESQSVKMRLNKTLRWNHDDISVSIARNHSVRFDSGPVQTIQAHLLQNPMLLAVDFTSTQHFLCLFLPPSLALSIPASFFRKFPSLMLTLSLFPCLTLHLSLSHTYIYHQNRTLHT